MIDEKTGKKTIKKMMRRKGEKEGEEIVEEVIYDNKRKAIKAANNVVKKDANGKTAVVKGKDLKDDKEVEKGLNKMPNHAGKKGMKDALRKEELDG